MTTCPKGKIRRVAYTTRRGTRVKSTCVPDKGKPGRTPPHLRVLPKPTPGVLGKYGYSGVKQLSAAQRHAALRRSIRKEGYMKTMRRVNLIANYTKLSDPAAHRIYRADVNWMRRTSST